MAGAVQRRQNQSQTRQTIHESRCLPKNTLQPVTAPTSRLLSICLHCFAFALLVCYRVRLPIGLPASSVEAQYRLLLTFFAHLCALFHLRPPNHTPIVSSLSAQSSIESSHCQRARGSVQRDKPLTATTIMVKSTVTGLRLVEDPGRPGYSNMRHVRPTIWLLSQRASKQHFALTFHSNK